MNARLRFERAATDAAAKDASPLRRIPGLVVGAGSADGALYTFKAGYASLGGVHGQDLAEMNEESVLWIASVTKLMTSVAAMQCVERGLITLDQSLEHVLPELKKALVLEGFDDLGDPITRPLLKTPTLRQLLSHSAGMGYDIKTPLLLQYCGGTPRAFCGRFSDSFAQTPFVYDPGQGWQYSGSLDWVGQMIQRLRNDMRLGDFMHKNIWTPLRMHSTTFDLESNPHLKARSATLSVRDVEAGMLTERTQHMIPQPAADDSGGAGAFSTVSDLMKLLHALATDGQEILQPCTVEEMFTSQLADPDQLSANLADPAFTMGMTTSVTDNVPLTFGIGGMILQGPLRTGRQAGSMQWGGLPNLAWWVDRKAGVYGIYGSQIIPPLDQPSTDMKWLFEEAAYEILKAKTLPSRSIQQML